MTAGDRLVEALRDMVKAIDAGAVDSAVISPIGTAEYRQWKFHEEWKKEVSKALAAYKSADTVEVERAALYELMQSCRYYIELATNSCQKTLSPCELETCPFLQRREEK